MALTNWTQSQILDQLITGYKWSGDIITYAFPTTSVGMYGATERTGFTALNTSQQAVATLALQTWDDLVAPDFQKTTASSSNIEMGFTTQGIGYAHAYMPNVGSVWLNSTQANLTTPQVGKHGFLTYIHEQGHAMGLDHMGNYNGSGTWTPSSFQDSTVYSLMSYFGPSWGSSASAGAGLVAWADWVGADGRLYSPQTPMLNDIMAIQAVYGVETSTRLGDTVYGFNCNITGTAAQLYNFEANKNPIMALFDSGGIDTLDLSGWSTASTISLVAGSFSSCNSMTNNLSIAYTCSIENATGGAGADQIVGNDLGNRLDGGAGNDTLSGGGGDDILIAGAGNDTIHGGAGNDQVNFSEIFTSYTYNYNAALQSWTFNGAATGMDLITGVELFSFADGVKTGTQILGGAVLPSSPVASISADSVSMSEGNVDSTAFNFTVKLDKASTTAQTVKWAVAGSGTSAAAASDFTSTLTGITTLAAGQTSAKVQVMVAGDTAVEANETFTVTLSTPSAGLKLGTAGATATISNDDVAAPADDYAAGTGTTGVVSVNGVSSSGTIEKIDDCDFFKVVLSAGTSYTFDLVRTGGTLNPYLELYNPSLAYVAINDNASSTTGDAKITYTALVTGTHYLGAWDTASGTGTYALTAKALPGLSLTGDASANRLTGTGFNDILKGLAGNDVLVGNAGADTLDGGAGMDQLQGGLGNDTLIGGLESDYFVFNGASNAGSNLDTVIDFQSGMDKIQLSASVFTDLGTATTSLSVGQFWSGVDVVKGHDADDRVLYNTSTGALYYDADGSGSVAAVQIALIGTSSHGAVVFSDVQVIA